jgi:type IV secretory pathway TraG/TraD family ATPase VirD4
MDVRLPNSVPRRQLRPLLICVSAVLLVLSLSQAYFVVRETVQVLTTLGWHQVKGIGPFLARCIANAACNVQFNLVLSERTTTPWRQILFALCFISLFVTAFFLRQRLPKNAYGNAHFATAKELATHERTAITLDNPARGHLGYWQSGEQIRYNDTLHRTHTLVIGKSGSGKTSRVFVPNILQDLEDGNSIIIFESKFPDQHEGLTKVIPDALSAGYEVYTLFPFHEHTMHYELIPQNLSWLEAEKRAFFFFPVDDVDKGAEYYTNNERILLKTLFSAYSNLEARSPKGLFDIITGPETMLQSLLTKQRDSSYLKRMSLFLSLTTMQQQSFLTGLVQGLTVFDNDLVSRAHTLSPYRSLNMDVRSLGRQPKLLLVGIPESTLKSGLGQLYLRMLYRFLVDGDLIPEAEDQGGKLGTPVTLYLDEFNNLGYLAGIMSQQATLRAKNISLVLGVQNRSMNEAIYGKATADAITDGNTATVITLPSYLSLQDREWLSEQGGSYTALDESKSKRFQGLSFLRSGWGVSSKPVEKRLFTPDDLKHFPDDMALIRIEGLPMIKSIMPRYFDERVRKVRNKFASSLASTTTLFDPVAWSILYLSQKRRTDELNMQAAAETTTQIEVQTETTSETQEAPTPAPKATSTRAKQVRRTPATTQQDKERDESNKLNLLKKLLDLVLERYVSYSIKVTDDAVTSLTLAWGDMPRDIIQAHHNRINEGLKRSLITVRDSKLRFTPGALRLVPETYRLRLMEDADSKGKVAALTPLPLPYSDTLKANLIAGDMIPKFRSWLETLPPEAQQKVTMLTGSVWLSDEEVEKYTLDVHEGSSVVPCEKGYKISLPDLIKHDALHTHVLEHVTRLRGHPQATQPSEDLRFTPTTITVHSDLLTSFKRRFAFREEAEFVLLEV